MRFFRLDNYIYKYVNFDLQKKKIFFFVVSEKKKKQIEILAGMFTEELEKMWSWITSMGEFPLLVITSREAF